MAHFAQLDENNYVLQVIAVNNNELLVDNVEVESKGIEFCQSLLGGIWVQTSYNRTFRKNYAGIGYKYDAIRDAFITPQCHLEAVLDEETCQWICGNKEHEDHEAAAL
jgi:hypothetical protein